MKALTAFLSSLLLSGCFNFEAMLNECDAGRCGRDGGAADGGGEGDGGPRVDADCEPHTAATFVAPDGSTAFCFNGFAWESPLPQGSSLEAVWGPAPDDVWAGGAASLLMHWDGNHWNSHQGEVEFDSASTRLGTITSFVTSPQGTWLAGFDLAPHFLDGGSSWTRGPQSPGSGFSWRVVAMGVSDDGANGPYAVTPNGEVFALDDWSQVSAAPGPDLPDYVSALVVGSDGLVAFSGTFQSDNTSVHRVWNVDGGRWTLDAGESGALWFENGVLLTASTNRNQPAATVWALNDDGGVSAQATRPGDVTFTAASFVREVDAGFLVGSGGVISDTRLATRRNPGNETTDLEDVQAFADGGAWAVGTGGALVHQEAAGWISRKQGLDEDLFDVWMAEDGGVFLCGAAPAVIERGTWLRTPAGAGRLRSLRWLRSGKWLVAAEDGNLYANGSPVYRKSAGDERPLLDLLVDEDEAWAVGTAAAVRRVSDGGWVDETPPGAPGQKWWKIARAGSRFMVAGNGRLAVYTLGAGWTITPEPNGASLFGVWTLDADAGTAWVVGSGPSIRRFDAVAGVFETNEDLPSGIYSPLFDVWGLAPDDVWAVGDEGLVMHYDGRAWSVIESGTRNQLERVRARVLPDGSRELIIVGSLGTVLRHRY